MDSTAGSFREQAADWHSLASMMAGGVAYRGMRAGTMALGSGRIVAGLSVATGLTAEVSAFEVTHRGLSSVSSGNHSSENPNLWRWNGNGGLRQGFLQSFVSFGALKGAGRLAQGENVVLQHLLQDTGMVLGHQATASLGITPRPTGSLAEQFLHAEATNLQLGAGMALAHGFAPGIHGVERGLDLSLPSEPPAGAELPRRQAALANTESASLPMAAGESPPPSSRPSSQLIFMTADGTESGSAPMERRHELRPQIEHHLSRLAERAARDRNRFLDLHGLNEQLMRLMDEIYRERGEVDPSVNDKLNRSADQLHRVLEVWRPALSFWTLGEMFSAIEEGLASRTGSILLERLVHQFCLEHGQAASARRDKRGSTPPALAQAREIRPYSLRDYQEKMVNALRDDAVAQVSPWLGLASPMQTGKSFLSGPIVQMLREGLGPNARFIILSSARVITDQVLGDLLGGFPSSEVGTFDGRVKAIRPVTVASAQSLVRHLEEFNHEGPTILINDEAYFTQAPIYRNIYTHFGLAEVVREGGREILRPKAGNGLVVGLSGTGAGLEGHHISGQLNLLDAIEQGWVRHMRGERVTLTISFEEKQTASESEMIWWTTNAENAEVLADIYDQKIHGTYRRNLIFVPTIQHAELLRTALRARHGDAYAHAVHSKMEEGREGDALDGDMDRVIDHWQQNGGALISVLRLARGFRGTGTDSVFHTYQTSSAELYSQRTGRAWGQDKENPLSELYVLEASWNPLSSFANLARVLGLVDYPHHEFSSRNLREKIESSSERRRQRRELNARVGIGEAAPLFARLPIVEAWRRAFNDILEREGGLEALRNSTGLETNLLVGYALGGLPTRRGDLLRLASHLGGEEEALGLWVRSWDQALEEIEEGIQAGENSLSTNLRSWRETSGDVRSRAESLNMLLNRHFHPGERPAPVMTSNLRASEPPPTVSSNRPFPETHPRIGEIEPTDAVPPVPGPAETSSHWRSPERLVEEIRKVITLPLTHEAIVQFARENTEYAEPKRRQVLQRFYLDPAPSTLKVLGRELGLSRDQIYGHLRLATFGLANALFKRAMAEDPAVFSTLLDQSTDILQLSVRAENCLQSAEIRTLGQLVQKTFAELRETRLFGPKSLQEIQGALTDWGLSLGMTISTLPIDPFPASLTEPAPAILGEAPASPELFALLDQPTTALDFSVRTFNCLVKAGIHTLDELVQRTPDELLETRHFSRKSLTEIQEILSSLNLSLGMEISRVLEDQQRLGSVGIPVFEASRIQIRSILERGPSSPHFVRFFGQPVDNLDLSVRAKTCLENAGIRTLGDLVRRSAKDLKRSRHFGSKSIREIEQVLSGRLLSLGMRISEEAPPAPQNRAPAGPIRNLLLDRPVSSLGLSFETLRILRKIRIHFVGELVQRGEDDLNHLKIVREIHRALKEAGLSFNSGLNWQPPLASLQGIFRDSLIEELGLPSSLYERLRWYNIETVEDLLERGPKRNYEPKFFFTDLEHHLKEMGLEFGMDLERLPRRVPEPPGGRRRR